jgi:hypothetical protein
MGVCRLAAPNVLRLYAVAGVAAEECQEGDEVRFEDFSPDIRPGQMTTRRIDDVQAFPVLLEPGRQPVVLTHPDHVLVLCHNRRPSTVIRLTDHPPHM